MGKYIKGHLIEQDVPMPKGKMAELAENMSVGDSVFVENRSRSNALCAELRKIELQGASRSVKNGYRVWRVK
tara:strand:+ start:769 stop:984 length:216 start_codon:yes stop_codon:yes gene_type:complete